MVFNKSDAQLAEYARIGERYEPTEYDKHWEQQLARIKDDKNKKETILSMTRLKVAEDEEYITYIHAWEGTDPIGSYVHSTQTDVGIFGKFQPIMERYVTSDHTYADRVVSKNTVVAYYIPFSKSEADKLHKLCNDKSMMGRTRYYIETEGGVKMSIDSYRDWVNGDFADLQEHGKMTVSPGKSKPKEIELDEDKPTTTEKASAAAT